MTGPSDQSRIFMLTLVATGPGDPYHGIKALLKLALRRYGLRCVNAREIAPPSTPERTRADEISIHAGILGRLPR